MLGNSVNAKESRGGRLQETESGGVVVRGEESDSYSKTGKKTRKGEETTRSRKEEGNTHKGRGRGSGGCKRRRGFEERHCYDCNVDMSFSPRELIKRTKLLKFEMVFNSLKFVRDRIVTLTN